MPERYGLVSQVMSIRKKVQIHTKGTDPRISASSIPVADPKGMQGVGDPHIIGKFVIFMCIIDTKLAPFLLRNPGWHPSFP